MQYKISLPNRLKQIKYKNEKNTENKKLNMKTNIRKCY